MNKVAILAYQGCSLFELGCAVELFGLERPEHKGWYSGEVISFDQGPLTSTCGVALGIKQIESLDDYSMLVISSWPTDLRPVNQHLANQILKFRHLNKRIISFCSGAFLLATLGILDNRHATTHWRYAEVFKQQFTAVKYVDDVLYVLTEKIGTSAGSAAAIDLGLAVIRDDFGSDIANQVARRLVTSPHRKGGQAQYIETPLRESNNIFDDTINWAIKNLNSDVSIDLLAEKSHMSRRTFDRRFRATHGCSPKEWLITQRLNLAKVALERNYGPIEHIAESTGFVNAHSLRRHFRNHFGISPRQYRDQFSSPANHHE